MGTTSINKDCVLGASLVLSIVSLILLLGAIWYFQSSLNLLQHQIEDDKELLLELQDQIKVLISCMMQISNIRSYIHISC